MGLDSLVFGAFVQMVPAPAPITLMRPGGPICRNAGEYVSFPFEEPSLPEPKGSSTSRVQ